MLNIPINRRNATAESAPQHGLSATLILALGTFAVGTDAFVLAGFLPDTATSLHVSTATAGQSVTVFAAAYALLSPIVATLTSRIGRRPLLVAALLVLALANLGSALSPTFAALLVTRVLAAAGAAAFTPNAGAAAASLVAPHLRARALAVVVGGLTIATALGVPLGTLIGAWMGWRWALGLVALACLLVAAGVAAVMPDLPGGPRVPLRTRLAVLREPAVLAVLPLTLLGMAAAYILYAYAVPALSAVGITGSATAWMLALYGIGAIAGNLGGGYATDRWSATRVLVVGYFTMAAAMAIWSALAATHTHLPILMGGLMIAWGAASWCQTPPQQHRLITAAPQEAPLVIALNASAIYLGIGAGTLLGGLTTPAGMATMAATAAALAIAALGYLLLTGSRKVNTSN
ncbi:MFS transporter [Nocardia sp. NPDC052001]|uniref:MFS transporter n=1 Tax=Nocardia sp. NPDC052001 TaxID=3154853 RepID=UPI0034266C35